ncbi:MAG: DUF885 domain-containing protein [Cyclobacteriaceae bacterium]
MYKTPTVKRFNVACALLSALIFFFFKPASAQTELQLSIDSLESTSSEIQRMHQLFEIYADWRYENYPESATSAGIKKYNDRWTDMSMEAIKERQRDTRTFAEAIATIDTSGMVEQEKLNYLIFRRQMDNAVAGQAFPDELIPVSNTTFIGMQHRIPDVLSRMSAKNESDYQNILLRMRGASELIDQMIALMEKGRQEGILPPRIAVSQTAEQLDQLLKESVDETFLKTFQSFPKEISAEKQAQIKAEGEEVFEESLKPAVEKLRDYLSETYIPASRDSYGISELTDGDEWYAYAIRNYTTTHLTADEIHQIGLREVARIRQQMDSIIQVTGFEGSFADFTHFLKTDPQFFYDTPEELLSGYRDICKRIDPELIRFFGKLPRTPYGVRAIPDYAAPAATTAYYSRGSVQAARPGYYYANTYDLKSRPKWEMEALSIHEAVPGHHLQISLAQEMEEVPKFRQNSSFTAFVEGWALYCESLGEDLGLYKDPYAKFGQLTYEMWRAIRLVVDTGIHSKGWTRDQALRYFKENSAKTDHDIQVEVDRYIAWPGQALAYKIGELKIKELRALAEEELGDDFDIRAFHDALLADGALPLDVLEQKMKEWIASEKAASPSKDDRSE